MVDKLTFAQDNRERIHAVQNSFGPAGKPLSKPGRVLIGEGQLMKMSRRGPQPKAFFLFNDLLVYGSIILNGRWHKKQQIIRLEDIQLEDLEDGMKMRNQWLIRTPRKSFYVAAISFEEKQAWIKHIEECRSNLLLSGGRRPGSTFAVTWIPDQASAVCMRCSNKFSVTHRRHHCRKCGFVVCGACSKKRAVIRHIHPTKWLRVCTMCHSSLLTLQAQEAPRLRRHLSLQQVAPHTPMRRPLSMQQEAPHTPMRRPLSMQQEAPHTATRRPLSLQQEAQEAPRLRGSSTEKISWDEDEVGFSEDEEVEEQMEDHDPSRWMISWSPYVYFKPEHTFPQA